MDPTDSHVVCTISAIASDPCHALRAAFGKQPSSCPQRALPIAISICGKRRRKGGKGREGGGEGGRERLVLISFFIQHSLHAVIFSMK